MIRLLALDGGGIRGLLSAEVLTRVERLLGSALGQHFELVAGTSTGGILAAGICAPQPLPAHELVGLYLDNAKRIFHRPWWRKVLNPWGLRAETYSPEGLRAALEEVFGDAMLSQCCPDVVLHAWDVERGRIKIFSSHKARHDPDEDFRLVDACLATAAAPTYFPPHDCISVSGQRRALWDGGLYANAPQLSAYAVARKGPGKPTAADMVMLSLGTGAVRPRLNARRLSGMGAPRAARHIVDVLMSAQVEAVDYYQRAIFEAAGVPGQYLRLQADLAGWRDGVEKMDNVKPENLERLRTIGDDLAASRIGDLVAFVDRLRGA